MGLFREEQRTRRCYKIYSDVMTRGRVSHKATVCVAWYVYVPVVLEDVECRESKDQRS